MLQCNIIMAVQHKGLTSPGRFGKLRGNLLAKTAAYLPFGRPLWRSYFVLNDQGEEVHSTYSDCWSNCVRKAVAFGAGSSKLYFRVDELLRQLSNPNLHDIANMSFSAAQRDRRANLIRSTVATPGSVSVGDAAFEQAVKGWPHQPFTLWRGMMLIREQPQ
jgi:hypothetical protein